MNQMEQCLEVYQDELITVYQGKVKSPMLCPDFSYLLNELMQQFYQAYEMKDSKLKQVLLNEPKLRKGFLYRLLHVHENGGGHIDLLRKKVGTRKSASSSSSSLHSLASTSASSSPKPNGTGPAAALAASSKGATTSRRGRGSSRRSRRGGSSSIRTGSGSKRKKKKTPAMIVNKGSSSVVNVEMKGTADKRKDVAMAKTTTTTMTMAGASLWKDSLPPVVE